MQVDALLCDAATVREGLLHALGGGITRIWRPAFPAILDAELALMITMTRTETEEKHRLRVLVQTTDGKNLAEVKGEVTATPGPDMQPGERLSVPIVLDLTGVRIPAEGTYGIDVLLDGQLQRSFSFVAATPPQPPPPQLPA